jgi:polysaccharide pyruvyl transferase WcaK-like protein
VPRVGFGGYYGMSNYGDDLFGVASVLGARKFWPDYVPRIIGPRSIGIDAEYGALSRTPMRRYQGSGVVGKSVRLGVMLGNAFAVDRYVFAGGSLFHSDTSRITDLVTKLVGIRGVPVSAIGVSLGPFRSVQDEKRAKRYLKRMDFIAVRDRASLDVAKGLGLGESIEYTGDLAGVLPLFWGENPSQERQRLIGFSPCALLNAPARAKHFCDWFVQKMVRVREHSDLGACVINLNNHPVVGDGWLCRYVTEKLGEHEVPVTSASCHGLGLEGTWRLIASLSKYVTVRLHGAVTAYATGTPFLLINYHQKCDDFLDDIAHPVRRSVDSTGCIDVPDDAWSSDLRPAVSVPDYLAKSLGNFTKAPWSAR